MNHLSLNAVCKRTGLSRKVILAQPDLPHLEVVVNGKTVRRFNERDVNRFIEKHTVRKYEHENQIRA